MICPDNWNKHSVTEHNLKQLDNVEIIFDFNVTLRDSFIESTLVAIPIHTNWIYNFCVTSVVRSLHLSY